MQTTPTTQTAIPANLGQISKAELEKLTSLNSLESMPLLMAGKEGFEAGKTYAGNFIETRKIVSDKLTTSKRDVETGKPMAYLHVFRDSSGNKYGIWGKGQLDGIMKNIKVDQFVAVTYVGLADAPLKKGQSIPHVFEVRGA